ncbi:energy transducer TonB [Terrimonas pollutisoli]|uniref:energy transducer TonB n=1 Tax=Terrimonas pollutisoli TaxID=3034147 RepID=UPI0023EBCD2A|nr:energy transducer TonB [Terrimonas sp. H1YJ31]
MDTNKILSADLLDLVFDNRNKDYGAYDLRKTYHARITKSLIFTGVFTSLIFAGVVLANKERKNDEKFIIHDEVTIANLKPEEVKPEPLPEPPRQTEPPQVRTEQLTPIEITRDEEVITPPPTQEDMINAKIDVIKVEGTDYDGTVDAPVLDQGKDIIEVKEPREPEIFTRVEIDAVFDGNWEKFLLRNLNPQTPIDNDAPSGNYTVLIQFVVDIDGNVSDIKALTNLGYGLEQEAIRVLKKAAKWKPAMQNGRQVKAYRKQAITFQVTTEE